MAENMDNKEEFNDIDENFGLPDLDLEPLDDSSEESVEETIEEESSFSDEYEEEEEENSDYVSGSYAEKTREQESNSGKIIGFIVIFLLIGGGVLWYFMYYKPAQVAAEKAKQEQIAAANIQKEKERLAAEEERLRLEEEARLQAEVEAEPQIGTIETISGNTGRYYVVVSSVLDDDLAMDYAKKEINNGTNIKLLSPLGISKFYRITVADHDTWAAAENATNDLKSTFGDDIWVLKY